MNRSHVTALLLTVFTLTVLGVAAGTLESTRPTNTHTTGTADALETSGGGGNGAVKSQSPSVDSSGGHFLLPELDATNSLQDEQTQSGRILARLALGIILLLFGAGLVLWRFTSDESHADVAADDEADILVDEPSPYTPPPDARNTPPTNGVYRAWQTMIAALDTDVADSKTPAELAETAVKSGLPESAVDTLTEMFCNVRYGGVSPTDEHEQHAQEALETIQQADRHDGSDYPNSSSEP